MGDYSCDSLTPLVVRGVGSVYSMHDQWHKLWPDSLRHRWWYNGLPSTHGTSAILFFVLFCRSVLEGAGLWLTTALVLCNVQWSGAWACMHWDICLHFSLVTACIPTAFHSWPRGSLVLFSSCFCRPTAIYAPHLPTEALCIRKSTMMPMSIRVVEHLKLLGGSFTKGRYNLKPDSSCSLWIMKNVVYRTLKSVSWLIWLICLPSLGPSW